MRTYETTHPWIRFSFDQRQISPKLWILLGEVQSKCEHIAGVPLRPTTAAELHRLYLAKGALGTTAIEGNTLTEKEVLDQLAGKLKLPPSKEYLGREIENIVKACDGILNELRVSGGVTEVFIDDIKKLNLQVLEGLPLNQGVVPGEIRTYSVGIEGIGYKGAPAEDCEYLLNRLCEWLNTDFRILGDDEQGIVIALLKAIISHLYLAWIHPFADGNGRTARLLEFKILLASGVPTPAAHLLSNFYNETRQEYYRQLTRASQSGGDVMSFVEYAVRGFVDGLRIQLRTIQDQQLDVVWRNYIHEKFKDLNKRSDVRHRHLALDISAQKEPIPLDELRNISPRIAAHYATLSPRALSRDIAFLEKIGLIEITSAGVRAKRETILSFLPYRREN
jgi:Fic family protein